jgi:hypothetical protein
LTLQQSLATLFLGLRESSSRVNAMNFPAEKNDRCRAYIARHLSREGFMPNATAL